MVSGAPVGRLFGFGSAASVGDLAEHFRVSALEVRNAVACNIMHEDKDQARYGVCFLDTHGWCVQARLCV